MLGLSVAVVLGIVVGYIVGVNRNRAKAKAELEKFAQGASDAEKKVVAYLRAKLHV